MVLALPFYFVLLEQYYTGEMYFPPINAVDDGLFLFIIVCFLSGTYGSYEFWQE